MVVSWSCCFGLFCFVALLAWLFVNLSGGNIETISKSKKRLSLVSEDTAHGVSAPTTSQRVHEYSNEEATSDVTFRVGVWKT